MKKTKYLTLIIAIGVLFAIPITAFYLSSGKTMAQTAAGVSFSDIASSPYKDAILFVSSKGIVQGYSDGSYRPDAPINRAEFTKIVMASIFGKQLSTYSATSCFSDVQAAAWYARYVCLAHDQNIIGGYPDRTFKPAQNINAAEALKITLNAFFGNSGKITEVSSPNWYQKYLDFSEKYSLKPTAWTDMSQNITRGEMAQFIYQILSPQAPGKITASLSATQLVPFSVIAISGSGFNPQAATSVIFTTSDNHIYTVPALSVSTTKLMVGVPPVNYNAAQGKFSSASVSLKVVQVTDNYSAFAAATSNQVNGLTITAPVDPSIYNDVAAKLPKGSISVAFMTAALHSLNDSYFHLPAGVSETTLTKAETSMKTVIDALTAFGQNPNDPVTLYNSDGSTTTLQPADIAQLDAVYAGILGEMEVQAPLVAYESRSLVFLPVVHADSGSLCMDQCLAGGANVASWQELCTDSCAYANAEQKAYDKTAPLIPEGFKFVYTVPLQVSGMMLDAAAEAVVGLAKVGQLAVASTYAFVTDALVNGSGNPEKPLEAIGESTLDGKLSAPGIPLFGVMNSSLEFFRKVNEAMSPEDATNGNGKAVIADTADISKVKFLEFGSDGKALVNEVRIPASSTSALQTKPGFEITPPTLPSLPLTQPLPEPTPQPIVEPETGELPVNVTITSSSCTAGDFPTTQVSGTASGPVGTELSSYRAENLQCGSWTVGVYECRREAGQPATTQWSFTEGQGSVLIDNSVGACQGDESSNCLQNVTYNTCP